MSIVFSSTGISTPQTNASRAPKRSRSNIRDRFCRLNEDAKQFRGNETRMIDLDGKTVVPGFTDSHCHFFGIGEREMNLNLEETNALEHFVAKIKERVAKTERDNGHWARLDRDFLEIFDGAPPRENSESWLAKMPSWL